MITTPNLMLQVPVVGDTSPSYALSITNSFNTLDLHDHSSGKGVPIKANTLTWAGLVVDLGYAQVQSASTLRFTDQTAASALPAASYPRGLFTVGGDLFFNTGYGAQLQLTASSALNATLLGGIGGQYSSSGAALTYNSASKAYTFLDQNSAQAAIAAGNATFTGTVSVGGALTPLAGVVAVASQTKTFRLHPGRGFWPNVNAQPTFAGQYYRPTLPSGTATAWCVPLPLPNYGTLTAIRAIVNSNGGGTAGSAQITIYQCGSQSLTGSLVAGVGFSSNQASGNQTYGTSGQSIACAGTQVVCYFVSAASSTISYTILSIEFDVTVSQLPDVYG